MAADGVMTTDTTTTTTAPAVVDDWRAGLTGEYEALRSDKSLEQIKGKDWSEAGPVLAKNYLETKKMVGAKLDGMVKLPGQDAKPEEIKAYHAAIGVPEAPDKYDLSKFGDSIDPVKAGEVLPHFHAAGLTNEQAVTLLDRLGRMQETWVERENEGYLQAHDAMVAKQGELVYNRNVQAVQRLVKQHFSEETRAWLDKTKATNHPGLFEGFVSLAQQFREARLPGGEPEPGQTVADIDKQIETTRAEMLKTDQGSPAYKALFDKYEGLWKVRADMVGAKA